MGLDDQEENDDDNQEEHPRPKKRRKKSSRPERIPHIDYTLHDVTKLEFLDLQTNTFHLPLGRVVKVWKLRDTKRGAFTTLPDIAIPCPSIEHAPMPRIPFGDDG